MFVQSLWELHALFSEGVYKPLVSNRVNLDDPHSYMITRARMRSEGYLRTKGQESVYETCACVIHTILLSYMCIDIVSLLH